MAEQKMAKINEYNSEVEGYNKSVEEDNKKHLSRTDIIRLVNQLSDELRVAKSHLTQVKNDLLNRHFDPSEIDFIKIEKRLSNIGIGLKKIYSRG